MAIDPNTADIASEYLYVEASEICYALMGGEMSDDDAIVNFRYAMALCEVLSELNAKYHAKDIEELIMQAQSEYPEEVLAEINMPNWF